METHIKSALMLNLLEDKYGSVAAIPRDDPDWLDYQKQVGGKIEPESLNPDLPLDDDTRSCGMMYMHGVPNAQIARTMHWGVDKVNRALRKCRVKGLVTGSQKIEYEFMGTFGAIEDVAEAHGMLENLIYSNPKFAAMLHKTGRNVIR